MKILLISGHGAGDPGAGGNNLTEATETREMSKRIAKELEKYADVTIFDTNKNAFAELQAGRAPFTGKYDYVLELHFNAGGGKGSEAYVTSLEGAVTVEQKVVDKLEKYFVDRGVKVMNWSVIYWAKTALGIPSCLLEICFIDSKSDTDTYKKEKDNVARQIALGVAEGFGLKQSSGGSSESTSKPKPKPPVDYSKQYYTENPKYVVLKKTDGLYAKNDLDFKKGLVTPKYPKGTGFVITGMTKTSKGLPRLITQSGFLLSANKDIVMRADQSGNQANGLTVGSKVRIAANRLYASGDASTPVKSTVLTGYIEKVDGHWRNPYRIVATKGKKDYLGFARKNDLTKL